MRDNRPRLRNWKVQPQDRSTRDEFDSDDGGDVGGGRGGGRLPDAQLGIVQGGLVNGTDREGEYSSNEEEGSDEGQSGSPGSPGSPGLGVQVEDFETPAETADALDAEFFSDAHRFLTRAHALLSSNGYEYDESDISSLAALSCAHEVEGHTNSSLWNDLGEYQSTKIWMAVQADRTAIFSPEPDRDAEMKRAIAWYCTNQDATWILEEEIVRAQELTALFNYLPPEVA